VSTGLVPPQAPYDFTVKSGSSLKAVARQLHDDGLLPDPDTFWIVGRALGKAGAIQAGTYRIEQPITPPDLLDKLARGDVVFVEAAFIEGTTFRQWQEALRSNPRVRQVLAARNAKAAAAEIGIDAPSAEGWLFPDTYRFAPGATDLEILKRAHAAMKKRLADAVGGARSEVPLATPYEALILASIVEKETGVGPSGRSSPRCSSIAEGQHAAADRSDGDLRHGPVVRRQHPQEGPRSDTPWNTYTRDGLPPTPIAMPGAASCRPR
jgi:UPF0755 protein